HHRRAAARRGAAPGGLARPAYNQDPPARRAHAGESDRGSEFVRREPLKMRVFAGVATAVVAALNMSACGPSDPLSNNPPAQQPGSTGAVAKPSKIIVGSANFPE